MRRTIAAIGRSQSRVLLVWRPTFGVAIAVEWKLADLWVGAYVYTQPADGTAFNDVNLYLIIIPTLVLHIAWLEPVVVKG